MAHNSLPHLSTQCKLFQIEMSLPIFDSVYSRMCSIISFWYVILHTNIAEAGNSFIWIKKFKNEEVYFINVPYLRLWVSIFKKEWIESEVTRAVRQSGLVLWGVWVVFCSFGQLLWSVHEGEEEQSHVIRAPIGCVWGHGWPVAALD